MTLNNTTRAADEGRGGTVAFNCTFSALKRNFSLPPLTFSPYFCGQAPANTPLISMLQIRKTLTVGELANAVKMLLEDGIGFVSVTGEISNYKLHTSGHRYFTLKDASGAQIACTMWRARQPGFDMRDGMNVVASGQVTAYPPQGRYQLDCASVAPLGAGELYLAFERLKEKLAALGWFDAARKRPLPRLPLCVGVATSPTGAAVRDIISALARRMPACRVVFRPTLVQGDGAAEDIAAAIAELNRTDCEALIVGRGGGSIEDLWAFNTETVAEAIFRSGKPVISAVGHETDVTIADFVADRRAATPTAAAELVTPYTRDDLVGYLTDAGTRLRRSVGAALDRQNKETLRLAHHSAFRRTAEKIRQYQQQADEAETRLAMSVRRAAAAAARSVDAAALHLQALHPLSPLRKGFALLRRENGMLFGAGESLAAGEKITLQRHNQTASALITAAAASPIFPPEKP